MQLLSEKISGAEGTKLDEDFMEMERVSRGRVFALYVVELILLVLHKSKSLHWEAYVFFSVRTELRRTDYFVTGLTLILNGFLSFQNRKLRWPTSLCSTSYPEPKNISSLIQVKLRSQVLPPKKSNHEILKPLMPKLFLHSFSSQTQHAEHDVQDPRAGEDHGLPSDWRPVGRLHAALRPWTGRQFSLWYGFLKSKHFQKIHQNLSFFNKWKKIQYPVKLLLWAWNKKRIITGFDTEAKLSS